MSSSVYLQLYLPVYLCSTHAVPVLVPVDSWDWDLLRELLGVLEAEERVEPALLAREMGRGTGVTGGESSCGEVRGQHHKHLMTTTNNSLFMYIKIF